MQTDKVSGRGLEVIHTGFIGCRAWSSSFSESGLPILGAYSRWYRATGSQSYD